MILEAVVLAHNLSSPVSDYSMMFVHDGTQGIFVNAIGQRTGLPAGTKVRVTGTVTSGDFAPAIANGRIEVLGAGVLPQPAAVSYDDLLTGKEDSQWVKIPGIIRAVSLVEHQIRFELAAGTRKIPIYVAGHCDTIPPAANLIDAEVTVTGACLTGFNPRGQLLSAILMTPDLPMIEVLAAPPREVDIPARGIDALLTFSPEGASGHRVKVKGIVSHCEQGGAVYLTDGRHSLRALTKSTRVLQPGEQVEAIGFPKPGPAAPVLDYSEFRSLGRTSPPKALPIRARQAISGDYEAALVSIVARVAGQTLNPDELRLLMDSDESMFPAKLALSPGQSAPVIETGSYLRLTGIALTEGELERREGAGFRPTAWRLNLRTPADIEIVRRPDWWTFRRVIAVLATLAVILLGTFTWILALGRRVRAQTAVIQEKTQREATLEERNRIARELHDTLAQGFAGTAFALEGISTMLEQDHHPVRGHVDMALNMVRHSLTEARRSLMNLRADALESRDLASALAETASKLAKNSDVKLAMDLQPLSAGLSGNVENNLFRIGVEAVINALRHADPASIHISLLASGSTLTLQVSDDGRGFDPIHPADAGHFGVLGMRERAKLIHADLQIASEPGVGTKVILTLPLGDDATGKT